LKKKEAKRIKAREESFTLSLTLSLLNICLFFFSLSLGIFFTIEIHSILERGKKNERCDYKGNAYKQEKI
jgi:hypothetical protein